MSFVFWWMMSSHSPSKKIQRILGANILGFLMFLIIKHISIGPLVVWPNWMPLSECDHNWMLLNALECALSAGECLWASIECAWTWTWLKVLWECVNAFGWALNAVEHAWVCMNDFGWIWMELNTLRYWFMYENKCARMPLSECDCIWTCWNVPWVHVNAFAWVLNTLECTLVHMNAFEWILNVNACAWMHLSMHECHCMSIEPMSVCTSSRGRLKEN